jgi:hypothetical protein
VFSRVEREAELKMTVENARPLQRILGLGFGVAIVLERWSAWVSFVWRRPSVIVRSSWFSGLLAGFIRSWVPCDGTAQNHLKSADL